MSKILPEHLTRTAFVYVRQSTAYQVVNNLESQRWQYGLVDRVFPCSACDSVHTARRVKRLSFAKLVVKIIWKYPVQRA
jgi:hypothetical protein